MKLKNGFHGQMSDKFRAAVFIILSGGFQDAYTYCCRGSVFANAQTGNIVLMSTALVDADRSRVIKYLIPVVSFIIGIAIAEVVHMRFKNCEESRRRSSWICRSVCSMLSTAAASSTPRAGRIAATTADLTESRRQSACSRI